MIQANHVSVIVVQLSQHRFQTYHLSGTLCANIFTLLQTKHVSGTLCEKLFTYLSDISSVRNSFCTSLHMGSRQTRTSKPSRKQKNKTIKTNIRNTKKTNKTNPRRRQPRDRAVHKETFRKTKKTKQTKKHKRTTKKTIKPIPGEETHEIVLCSVDVCKNIVFLFFFCFACSNVFLCCFVVFLFFLTIPYRLLVLSTFCLWHAHIRAASVATKS